MLPNKSGNYTEAEIRKILRDKETFGEFVSAAIIDVVYKGLDKTKDPTQSLSAITKFLDVLRRIRADLTGDDHEARAHQMLVNIQFGQSPKAVPLIAGAVLEDPDIDKPAKVVTLEDKDASEHKDLLTRYIPDANTRLDSGRE